MKRLPDMLPVSRRDGATGGAPAEAESIPHAAHGSGKSVPHTCSRSEESAPHAGRRSGKSAPHTGRRSEESAPHAGISLLVRGIVQGVGMRPFLYRLALRTSVTGWARNTSGGLEAELEGSQKQLDLFLDSLTKSPPPLAVIESVSVHPLAALKGYEGFSIRESADSPGGTLLLPDLAPCPSCERELFSPSDRRFRYPFLNCTDCGPRYTIVKSLPYDRKRTVMDLFPMCGPCREEYEAVESRRFHAQPNCCPACGPSVRFLDENGAPAPGSGSLPAGKSSSASGSDPVALGRQLLSRGGILAVKGTGGIHLACDARNKSAVKRLRERKSRPAKPLALMCRSLEALSKICLITKEEAALLQSPRRPVVLLQKKDPESFKNLSFSPRLGVMLPYTPLHMLLLGGGPELLVMTSANLSGCPVLTGEREALEALSGIADGYLLHNRPIENRCDDSVLAAVQGMPYFFRRSRGYAPEPLSAEDDVTGICAFGAEQKASFALGRENHVFLSPYIGDLKNLRTQDHYRQTLQTYLRLFQIKPSLLVCDLHPDYISTGEACEAAKKLRLPLLQVQHHWAHMVSCMADNRLRGPVFGIVWDGTGLGTDETVWGGEFLTGDADSFQRAGSIRPVALPGGDRAVTQIGRIALSLCADAKLPSSCAPLPPAAAKELCALLDSGVACPEASSIGRLFDGICSLLLQKTSVSYDGEAACLLEAVSAGGLPRQEELTEQGSPWPLLFYEEEGVRRFDTRPLVQAAVRELQEGISPSITARRFMLTLIHMALDQCLTLNPERLPVVLSGGVFLNRFLLEGIRTLLTKSGYTVYIHSRVSACDEGVCLGQLAIARAQRSLNHVPCSSYENN